MSFTRYVKIMKKNSSDLRIVVIGLDGSGKTTLINKLFHIKEMAKPTFGYTMRHFIYQNISLSDKKKGKKEQTMSTIGLTNSRPVINNDTTKSDKKNVFEESKPEEKLLKQKITIIDVGGQECLRKYWSNFYDDINGLIFVYDMFDNRNFLEEFNKIVTILPNYTTLLLGNKIDLDIKRSEILNSSLQEKLKETHLIMPFGVSAKTGKGLREAFQQFVDRMNKTLKISAINKDI